MKHLLEMFRAMGIQKVQTQITQMRLILVHDEIQNWLLLALGDRMGRPLTFNETEVVNLFAQKLQTEYEKLLDEVQEVIE